MSTNKKDKTNYISTILMALIISWFVFDIAIKALTLSELKGHNDVIEKLDKEYKDKSIKVSEEFNKKIENLGK